MKKILFIAPRFHTNQVFAIKSLIRNGVEVRFLSQYAHKSENYEDITPIIIGYSLLFNSIYNLLLKYFSSLESFDFSRQYGIPPIFKIIIENYKFNPDLVILRDYSVYMYLCLIVMKIFRKKCIVYTQQPFYDRKLFFPDCLKNILKGLLYDFHSLLCKYETTPILGSDINEEINVEKLANSVLIDNDGLIKVNTHNIGPLGIIRTTFFVPFVIDKKNVANMKKKRSSCYIKIIIVAEFQERKKILEFLEIFKVLIQNGKMVHLTIIGNAKKVNNLRYLSKVLSYIEGNFMNDEVTIKTDLTHHEVFNEYLLNDIFILPSVREPASYSVLEAMSCGLPVICSSSNGIKNYIVHGKNGYIFDAENFFQLHNYLVALIENPPLLNEFGNNSLMLVENLYNSNNYYMNIKIIYNKLLNENL
ncbi:glycosyltransferase family 4 protein [Methanospirillum sp.]|uniref:glycosyltransferase family 4 protein n=1 Tax=Methanospirillum sp. TaxID=45200 RepID=UPI0035A1AF3A